MCRLLTFGLLPPHPLLSPPPPHRKRAWGLSFGWCVGRVEQRMAGMRRRESARARILKKMASLIIFFPPPPSPHQDLLLTFLIFFPGIIYAVYIIFNANRGGLTGGAV